MRRSPFPACRAMPMDRCSASRGKRRRLRWRWRCIEKGLFTWKEWAAALADEIKRAQAAGDPDTGETYYRHWLATLENLVAAEERRLARDAAPLSRRLGPRRRPHPAWHADRTAAGRFRVARRTASRIQTPCAGMERSPATDLRFGGLRIAWTRSGIQSAYAAVTARTISSPKACLSNAGARLRKWENAP